MKLFVFSDCHGFYTELMTALNKAGFESGNPEHLLVGGGDYLDRGREPQKIIDYLMSVPNKVLVQGNHESLILNMMQRGYPHTNDLSNGTYQTVWDLAPGTNGFNVACVVAYEKLQPLLNQMVNYYETEHYVFVHSALPLGEDWREAHFSEWENARWWNPFEEASIYGNLPEHKTLIFGHWHTSWMWSRNGVGSEWGKEDACFDPYYGDGFIGIDACTGYTRKVNVLVLEDNLI